VRKKEKGRKRKKSYEKSDLKRVGKRIEQNECQSFNSFKRKRV